MSSAVHTLGQHSSPSLGCCPSLKHSNVEHSHRKPCWTFPWEAQDKERPLTAVTVRLRVKSHRVHRCFPGLYNLWEPRSLNMGIIEVSKEARWMSVLHLLHLLKTFLSPDGENDVFQMLTTLCSWMQFYKVGCFVLFCFLIYDRRKRTYI